MGNESSHQSVSRVHSMDSVVNPLSQQNTHSQNYYSPALIASRPSCDSLKSASSVPLSGSCDQQQLLLISKVLTRSPRESTSIEAIQQAVSLPLTNEEKEHITEVLARLRRFEQYEDTRVSTKLTELLRAEKDTCHVSISSLGLPIIDSSYSACDQLQTAHLGSASSETACSNFENSLCSTRRAVMAENHRGLESSIVSGLSSGPNEERTGSVTDATAIASRSPDCPSSPQYWMNLKPNATTDASSSKLAETLQTSNIKAQPSHTIPGNVFSEIEQDSHPSAYIPKQSGRHYDTGDDGYRKDENQHLKYEDLDRDAAADFDIDDRGSTSDSTDSQIPPNVSEVKKLFLYNQNVSTPVITKEPEASNNCCPYEKLQKDRVVTQVSSTDSQHWLGYGSFNAAFNESECFQDLHQLSAHESRHTSPSVCFGMQWSPDSYKETCDIFCQRKSLKNATEFMDTDEWDVVEDRSNPDNTSGASGAIYRMPGRETMGNDIITRMQYIVPGATNQTKTGVIEGSLLQGSSSTSRNNNSRYSEENFPVTDTSHLEQFVQSVTGMRALQSEPTAVTCGFLDNLIQPSLTDTYHLGMGNWNQANEPVRAMRNLFVDVNMYDGEVASQSEVSAKPTCSDAAGMVGVQTSSRTRTACTYLSSTIQKESHKNTRKTRNDLQTEGSANYCSFTQYESRDTTELAVESNQSPRCQSPHKLQSPALDSDEKLATDLDGYLNSSTSSRQPMTELVDSRVYVDSSLSSFTPWPTGSEQEPVNLLRRCPHFENISSLWECYSGDVESAVPEAFKVPDAPFDAQEEEFDYSEGVNDKLTRTWFRETSQRDQQPQALIDLQQEDVMWSNLFSPSDSLVESAKEVSLQLNLMSVTGDDEAEAVDAFMHRTSSLDHLKKLSSGLVWPSANISEVQETFLQQNPDFSTTLPKEQYHTDDPESRAVLAEEQSTLPEVRGQDDRECNKHGLHIQQTCAPINSIIPFANTSEAMINMISQSSMHQENTSIDCQTSKVGNELGTNKSDSADTVVRSLTIARNKVSYGEIDRPDEAQIDHVTSRPVRDIPLGSYGEDTRLGSKCVGDSNASSLQIAFGTLGSAVGVTGCLSPLFDVDQSIGSPSVSINTGEQTGAEVDTRSTQFNEYATACTGHNWYAAPLRISDLRNLIYPSEQKFRNEPKIPCFTSKAETAVELTGGPINHGGITTDVSYNTSPKELSILSTDNLPLFYLEQPPVQPRRHEEFESFVPSVCYTWLGTKTSADPGLSTVNPKDRSATAASSISDRGREIAKRTLISKRPTSPATHYSFLCHWDNPLTANFSADPSDFLTESGLFTAHKCSLKAITCTGWRSFYPRVTDDCLFSPEDSISDFVITEQPRNFYNRLLHNSLSTTRTFKNNFSQLLIVETEPVTLSKAKHRLNLLQRIQEEAVLTLEEHTPASTDLQTELMYSHADCVLRRRRPRSSSYTYSTHPATDGLFYTHRQDGRRRHSSHAWGTGDKFSAVGRFKAVDDSYADRHLVKDDFDLHRFQRSPSMHRLSSRIYARDDEWHPVHDPVFGTGYGSSCGGRYSANGFFRSSHVEPRDVRYFAPNSSTCDCPRAIHTGNYLYPSKFTVQPKTVVNRHVKRESVRLRHNILDGDIPHHTGKWQTESDAYSAVASLSSLLRRNYEEDLRKAKTCTAQDPFSHSGRSLGYLKEILQRDGAECHIYSPGISPVAYALKRPASLRSAPAPSGYRGGMLSKSIEYLGPKNYLKLGAFDTSMHTLRARLAAARSESYLNSAMEETAEPLIDTSEIKYRSLDRHYGRADRTTVQLRRQVERQHRQLLENLFKETSSDFGLAPCMYTDPVTTVSAICDQLYHRTTLGAVLDDKTMNYPPQAPLISSTMAPPIFTTAALQNMADGYSAWTSSAASFTPVNRPPSDVLLSTQTPPALDYTSTQLQPQTLVPQSEELTAPADSNANLLELLQDPKFLQSVALNPELTAQLASLCSDFTLTDANQVTLAAMTGAITATAIANAGLIDGSVCNLDGLWNLANDPVISEFKEQESYSQNDWIHPATKTSEQPTYELSSLDNERLEQVLQQLRMILNKDLGSQNDANAEMAARGESDARHLGQTVRYNGLAHAVDSNISAHPSSFPANTQSECIRPSEAVNSWLVTNSNFTDRAQATERTDLLLPAMDWPTFVTAQPTPRPTCGKHERAKHVYDFPTKRILIMRDSRDRYQKKNGIGMRIVGGHVRSDGRLGAFVEEIDPRGSVDQLHGEIQEGDEILEWNSVSLVGRTFEEVQAIISQVTEETELLVRAREDEQHGSAGQPWDRSVVKQSRQQPMEKVDALCHHHAAQQAFGRLQHHHPAPPPPPPPSSSQQPMCPHMQQHFASISSGAPLMRPGQLTHSHTPLMQHSSSTGSDSATSADRKSSSRHAGSNPGNDFDEDLRSGTSPVASLSDGQLTSTPGGPISPHGQVSIVSDSITPSKFGRRGSTKSRSSKCEESSEEYGEIELILTFDDSDQSLTVHVARARGLPGMDLNGLADPFVKVRLHPDPTEDPDFNRQTKYMPNTLTPEWQQTVVFMNCFKRTMRRRVLEVTVWDFDRLKTNDFMGQVLINLGEKNVLDGQPHWYRLHKLEPIVIPSGKKTPPSIRSRASGGRDTAKHSKIDEYTSKKSSSTRLPGKDSTTAAKHHI